MIGGTGGQGVITIGYVLASAASEICKNVTRFPIYLAMQRGGAAYCTVVFANEEIAAPILSRYQQAIAMDSGSYAKFKDGVKKGGKLFVNSSLVTKLAENPDIKQYPIPVIDMAKDMGAPFMANMIMLGAYIKVTGVLEESRIMSAIEKILADEGKAGRMDLNITAFKKGADYAVEQKFV